jgi:hypothetical protein
LYIQTIGYGQEFSVVATSRSRTVHKNFRLDPTQIAKAQKVLGAATETETIIRALDHVISEAERNRITAAANQRFLKSGMIIDDAFGSLG